MGSAKRNVFSRETFGKIGIVPLASELLLSVLSFVVDNVKTANKSIYVIYTR
jgi:hypothetical protein